MKISDVSAWLFHYPLSDPFNPSWIPGYSAMNSSAVIYKLTTDEGLEGICGGVAFADEAKGPLNLLRAYLIGLDVEDVEEVHSRLSAANRVLGVRAWFVEVAFWDLLGKAQNKSLASLLGGNRDRIAAYASTGTARPADAAAEHAAKVVAEGFTGIKIRPRHSTLDEDIAMVRAVREAIGPDVALMCDANQAWRVDTFGKGPVWDLDRAIAAARAMEEYNVTWLEEPLDMYDLEAYGQLRKSTSTPIAAGELHGEPGLVRLLMKAEGVDVVQPDLVFTGGVTGAVSLAREAADRGLKFAPHTWSNGLGFMANLHVAMAAANCDWIEYPYDPPGWIPQARDAMLTEPVEVLDGMVALPDAPGLGVSLDEEKLSSFAMAL